jgi:hypothetical protein
MTLTVRFLGLQEDQKEQPTPVIKQQPLKVHSHDLFPKK